MADSIRVFTLDARRLLCPMPVIRLQNYIRQEAQVGDEIQLLATDPGVRHDVPAWCRVHGHELIVIEEQNDFFSLRVIVR